MKFAAPGRLKTFDAFRDRWSEIAPELGVDETVLGAGGPLGKPLDVEGKTLENRFAIHPMEGWDGTAEGRPSELTRRRWRSFGKSGASLLWGGEAFAVQADGRANPNQLFLNDAAEPERTLVELIEEVREGRREIGASMDDCAIGLQLTHSGRFARPGKPVPKIAWHDPRLDAHFGTPVDLEPLTDGELEGIGERYVRAAVLAAGAGFDFVDVKCCHGYLMHELLGATGREGKYGGSFDNRTRLFREIVREIRQHAPDIAIGVRVSIVDVAPHRKNPDTGVGEPIEAEASGGFGVHPTNPTGIALADGFQFLGLLESLGIRLVNLTIGSPYYCPHLQRPATYPPSDGYLPPRDPLYEVATHLRVTRAVKKAFPKLTLVGTGYSYLQEWLANVGQHEVGHGHVDFVGLGRMVLSYPELPRDVLSGAELARKKICRTFSDCTTGPRQGLVSGCFPLDPHYKEHPDYARLQEGKRS